ncbi:hypothetical protein LOTGIDRAFT_163195 [Lottia gigantea]|uniref:Uncharacterized protein n=1 Tax=Lottia gigantea TaxID=225164 RepID=V3ZKJ9_LOTGI|nr:hypothetical protein LOTGIDRAFT_163195 [Lottia gigantea]ESO91833.1 hypothetical protein LOTGIDRAFT_163195 [Lottia gigantea]
MALKVQDKSSVKEEDLNTIIRMAMDSISILSSGILEMNQLRRDSLKPDMNNNFKMLCNMSQHLDTGSSEWFLGNDWGKRLKNLRIPVKLVLWPALVMDQLDIKRKDPTIIILPTLHIRLQDSGKTLFYLKIRPGVGPATRTKPFIVFQKKPEVSQRLLKQAKLRQSLVNWLTIRKFSQLIGLIVAAQPGVKYAQLYYRCCDNYKTAMLKLHQECLLVHGSNFEVSCDRKLTS